MPAKAMQNGQPSYCRQAVKMTILVNELHCVIPPQTLHSAVWWLYSRSSLSLKHVRYRKCILGKDDLAMLNWFNQSAAHDGVS